ncbi:MAG: hypothetical protein Q9202_007248 [Teloschistes flavicans]
MAAVRNSSYGDLNNIQILCGPEFRSATSGCQIASCSPGDLQTTSILSQQLCGPLYNGNATLGSSVSSAIASATAAAKAAIDGKDPTNLAVYPACAPSTMPHKHKRLKTSSASTSHDLPPTSLARPLPVVPQNLPTTPLPRRRRRTKKPSRDDDDDTPRAFTRLMAYASTGLKTPRGLDAAPPPPRTPLPSSSSRASKKRRHEDGEGLGGTPRILPGERMGEFAARVDREMPLGRGGGAGKGKGKGKGKGEGERQSRLEMRMQRMQREWREEDRRRKEREEEAREEEEGVEGVGDGVGAGGKGRKKGKRKGGMGGGSGGGGVDNGGESEDEEDPWAIVARNRKREMEERERVGNGGGGGGGLVGLHDVVQAPPKFSKLPKKRKTDVADMVKKGGLKRTVELSEARKAVIEGYRAMMREKSKIRS